MAPPMLEESGAETPATEGSGQSHTSGGTPKVSPMPGGYVFGSMLAGIFGPNFQGYVRKGPTAAGGGSAGGKGAGGRSEPVSGVKADGGTTGGPATQPEQEPVPSARGAEKKEGIFESIERMQKTLKEKREKLIRARLLEEWAPKIQQATGG